MVLHNAWITEIRGDPVYTACKLCYTKIDAETGLCKRSAMHGCKTERGQEAVLAHAQIADCTGVVEDVLVNAERLTALGGLTSETEVIAKVKAHGPQSLCFRGPYDIRLGTAKFMKQWRRPGLNQTENLLSQFEVLGCRASFGWAYSEDKRPMVKQITRFQNASTAGAVLPVTDLYKDLSFSDMGIYFPRGQLFVSYVCVVVEARDEPDVEEVEVDGEKHLITFHKQVFPFNGASSRPFKTEAICHFKNCHLFNMGDNQPRILVGRPHADPETGEITFNIEWLRGKVGEVVSKLQAEQAGIWQLLATSPQTTRNKRPASGLVSETPSKVKCAAWGTD